MGLKAIPYIGAAITIYEGYELTKDAYEYLKESPDLQKELQELHEQYPDKFPAPPSLEDIDKTSFFSTEEKENIILAMNEFDDNQTAFSKDIEEFDLIELSNYTVSEPKIEQELPSFSDEDKEWITIAMESFEENSPNIMDIEGVEYLENEMDKDIVSLDTYVDSYDNEIDDGFDGGDADGD